MAHGQRLAFLCLTAILYCTLTEAILRQQQRRFPQQRAVAPNRNTRRFNRLSSPQRETSRRTSPTDAHENAQTVYYVQRDGRVMVRKPIPNPSDPEFMDRPLHHPVSEATFKRVLNKEPNVRVVHTNALTQNIPNGARVGEITSQMANTPIHDAYPLNIIQSESPNAFSSPKSIRSGNSVDQLLEKIRTSAGANHPTDTNTVVMELDMAMTRAQYRYYYQNQRLQLRPAFSAHERRIKRKALRSEFTYWPKGVIPYMEDNTFDAREKFLLRQSMQDWMEKTCIRFQESNQDDINVLRIQHGQGCNSFVGRIGGKQDLNLEPGCRVKHVMTHELGHVIGLIHEHQRPDRDVYIRVATQNVGLGRVKNYNKFADARIHTFGVDYDYTSIMHYGKTAFSKDGTSTTMITKDPNFQDIIGTSSRVSFKDAKLVNAMYKCADHCSRRLNCGSGYMNKRCRCVCPDGTQSCMYTPPAPTRRRTMPRTAPRTVPRTAPRTVPRTVPRRRSRRPVNTVNTVPTWDNWNTDLSRWLWPQGRSSHRTTPTRTRNVQPQYTNFQPQYPNYQPQYTNFQPQYGNSQFSTPWGSFSPAALSGMLGHDPYDSNMVRPNQNQNSQSFFK